MLADKLRGAAAAVPLPIEYVGGYVEGFPGTMFDKVISLTSLTGGLASAPSAGDFVLIYFGTGSNVSRIGVLNVAGYTEVTKLYSNDTYDANLVVAYKFMSGTPATTLTLTNGTTDSSDSGLVVIQVWRNVDTITPLDVAFTSATGIDSARPDPPAITPITDGAIIVAGGSSAHYVGIQTFTSSDLTDFRTVGVTDTNDGTIGLGYKEWTSGAFNPARFVFSTTNPTAASHAAVTLALRPA